MILPTLTYAALPIPAPFDKFTVLIEEDRVCGLILREEMRRFHDAEETQRYDFGGSMVYVLHNAENDSVKIGLTRNFRQRWRELENAGGVELTPLVLWYTRGFSRLETNLHGEFANARRSRGEWFDAAGVLPSLSTVIDEAERFVGPPVIPAWMVDDDEDTAPPAPVTADPAPSAPTPPPAEADDPMAALNAIINGSQSKLDNLLDLVSEDGES